MSEENNDDNKDKGRDGREAKANSPQEVAKHNEMIFTVAPLSIRSCCADKGVCGTPRMRGHFNGWRDSTAALTVWPVPLTSSNYAL